MAAAVARHIPFTPTLVSSLLLSEAVASVTLASHVSDYVQSQSPAAPVSTKSILIVRP